MNGNDTSETDHAIAPCGVLTVMTAWIAVMMPAT